MDAQNTRKKRAAQAQKDAAKRRASLNKTIAARRKTEDKRLSAVIKKAEKYGIYNPKSTTLTKYRRSVARKIERDYGSVMGALDVKFIKAPKKARQKAARIGIQTSKTGIFVIKGEYKDAKLVYDKKTGEFGIKRTGKTKDGTTKRRKYTDLQPLVAVDNMDDMERLLNEAKKLGPVKDNERLAFVVHNNGIEGISKQHFSNMDALLAYLDKYPLNESQRVAFLRLIHIEKYATVEKWREDIKRVEEEAKQRTAAKVQAKMKRRARGSLARYARAKGRT